MTGVQTCALPICIDSDAPAKSVILINLMGGPSHIDMFDMKPAAPDFIRGEFKPIATNVPGIQIGECFPKIAQSMDKAAVLRAVVGCEGRHDSFQCMTGFRHAEMRSIGGHPAMGSVLHKLQGPADRSVPPYVGMKTDGVWRNPGTPGFLGATYAPFIPDGAGLANMKLNGVTTDRLSDRKSLLKSVDRLRRDVDASGQLTAIDSYEQQAFDVLTSPRLAEALDLSREERSVKKRYGLEEEYPNERNGKTYLHQFLLARRVIEAGARCVRSEEHTSELQSLVNLVCRPLLGKKKKNSNTLL